VSIEARREEDGVPRLVIERRGEVIVDISRGVDSVVDEKGIVSR
jgi:hypothetical protein